MMERQRPISVEIGRKRLRWRRQMVQNEQRMEVYRGILRSGFKSLTEATLENTCHLFQQLQKLKQQNRRLARALLESQNKPGPVELSEVYQS